MPPVVSKKVAVPEVGEAVASAEIAAAVAEATSEVLEQASVAKAEEVAPDAPTKE